LWSWFILCSATADFSVCANLMCLTCSLIRMCRRAALSNIYLPTFTRDAAYTGCSQSHGILERWEVIGYFLRWEWDTFNAMFGQHSAKST
jgi:hypothetical protein